MDRKEKKRSIVKQAIISTTALIIMSIWLGVFVNVGALPETTWALILSLLVMIAIGYCWFAYEYNNVEGDTA